MKLLLLIPALLSATAASANQFKHARVFPGVLPDDTILEIHGQVGSAVRRLRHGNKHSGEVTIQPEVLQHILKAAGDDRQVHEPVDIRSTLVSGGVTTPHLDSKPNYYKFQEGEHVMLMFLETKEGAYFQIEGEKVPVVAGTLVSFNGDKKLHNTVVPDGSEVHMLGPFASKDFQGVGSDDEGVGSDDEVCGDCCGTQGCEDACQDGDFCDPDTKCYYEDDGYCVPGCVYHQRARFAYICMCISCGSTCGLENADSNNSQDQGQNQGRPSRDVPVAGYPNGDCDNNFVAVACPPRDCSID